MVSVTLVMIVCRKRGLGRGGNRKIVHLALHPFVVGWDMLRFVRDEEHLFCIDRYFPLTLERL